jgi:putative transposase
MRRIDELHLEHPFMGARMLRDQLNRAGIKVGRRHVGTLMKRMGDRGLVSKAGHQQETSWAHDLSLSACEGLTINRSQPGLGAGHDLYPDGKGLCLSHGVVDWASRKVLAAKIAITLEACHAVDVLQEAFNRHGAPEIVNTDQGSQFTADEFVKAVEEQGCRLSMDGRGAWRDNVLLNDYGNRSNMNEVYLHAYDSVNEARNRSCAIWTGTTASGHIPIREKNT